ncbi:MAG TPA: IPT/TIG domain-containing protein [Bryobacteraceae bacterium]|nr:IPT/TIG domain-containing protein [Bryobacteraceae bacterium]
MKIPACKWLGLVVAFSLLAPVPTAFAQQPPSLQIKSFSVGPDQTLSYPSSQLPGLPDEHVSFMPPASSTGPYLLFGASRLSAAGSTGGAVVLETTDFVNFTFPASLGYQPQVMTPPTAIDQCNPATVTEFDANYAAPGSVVQDPTLPAGNFIMIYEAENHCPGGVLNIGYYATAGFARSSDSGKTWPAPINGVLGGPARHPVLQSSDPQPSVPHIDEGDAIPSAFVDLDADRNYFLYVSYEYHPATGNSDGLIRVARAKLGADPLNFEKWYNGSFSQPGIGGSDTGVTPSVGCAGGRQLKPELNYNDDLGLYLMIFVCLNGPAGSRVGAWYYSTATSLDLEDWTPPQMIQNSQFPDTSPCPGLTGGDQFDGWYPSTVSPGAAAGHTKLTGYFFFLNGCDNGARQFMSRTFTIVTAPIGPQVSLVANAEGESPTIAPNTWVEVKGVDLAPAGDSRIWQGSDFVNNQMPVKLDGVSVTVNGKGAYVYYISPGQLNILTPPDAMSGPVQVVVTNNGTVSAAFTAQAQPLSPSFFVFDATNVAATHADGTLLGPPTLYPGSTTPAKPGETVVLYANGFGPTSTPVVSGSTVQSGTLSPPPLVKIGGVAAAVQFAGLVAPGEFQFNVIVPASLADGDQPIMATYSGLTTQPGTLLAIQH